MWMLFGKRSKETQRRSKAYPQVPAHFPLPLPSPLSLFLSSFLNCFWIKYLLVVSYSNQTAMLILDGKYICPIPSLILWTFKSSMTAWKYSWFKGIHLFEPDTIRFLPIFQIFWCFISPFSFLCLKKNPFSFNRVVTLKLSGKIYNLMCNTVTLSSRAFYK